MATIRDVAEVLIKINDEEAKKQLPALQKKVEELGKEFDELRKNGATNEAIKEQGEKFKKTFEQMDALRRRTQSVDEAMQHLSTATPKELRRILSQINRELNSGYIERGTEEWNEYNEKLKQVKAELKKIADEQKVVTDAGLSMKDMLDIGGNLSMIFGSFIDMKDSVADFVRNNVDSYIALDAEMANVRKYTGLTREEVELLNRELDKLDTRTSKIKLNQLVEEGGRGGLRSIEELLQYAKAADIINVALDELGEGATEVIFKLSTIFGDKDKLGVEGSMMAVGSVVNDLSQNMVAQAPYITEYINRLAGVGAMAEMTIPQIAAYGAVLNANGQNVEKSATATSRLLNKMFQEPAKIAQVAGLEVSNFTQLVKTDINAAFIMLLEHLNSLGKMDVLAPIFKEMNIQGDGATATLTTLAKNIELVKQKQQEAQAAYEDATSVIKESNVQNTTEEAKLEKKRKKLEEVKAALGEKLLPIMSAFTSTGTMMMQTIGALLDVFNQYKTTIISTGSAVLLYTGYVKAKNFITQKEIILKKLKVFWNEKVITSLKKLNTTVKAHKFGILSIAVVFLISRLYDLAKAQNNVNRRMEEMGKIETEAKNSYQEEANQIKALRKVLEDNNTEIGARRIALKKLQEIVPEYHASLTNEGKLINNNTSSLENYVQALRIAAEQEVASRKLADAQTEKREFWAGLGENRQDRYIQTILNKQLNPNISEEQAAAMAGISPAVWRTIDAQIKEYDKKIELYNSILNEKTKEMAKIQSRLNSTTSKKSTNVNGYTGGANDEQTKKEIALAEQTAKEKWEKRRILADAAYSRGEITYTQHIARLNAAENQYIKDCEDAYKKLNATEESGYSQLLEKKKQLAQKQYDHLLNMSLEELERQKQTEQNEVLENCYDVNSILFGNEKVRDQRLYEINIDYLHKKAALYRQAAKSKEAYQIEQQIAKAETDEALRKQQEYAQRLLQWRKEYAGSSSEVQMQAELTVLDEMHKAGLVKEDEYQKLRKSIQGKYSNGGKFSDGGYGDMLTNMYTSIDALISSTTDKSVLSMEKIGAVAQSTWAIAGAALQQYSAYSQACCDVEVAEIEKKYDKMIAAAGKNSTKAKQLEEQKEKQIAKVKTKYSKQAQKIEIAGAIAQTAVAAINAYASASKENWLLGPIAAAMAIAAGAIQIATIRKQHQAQQVGYYTGGYTKRSIDNREEVGVVHANEFVANATATRNPALIPIFNLIDHAQRNNTIGSLTSSDVSHALGTGAIVKATATTAGESVQNSGELLVMADSVSNNAKVIQRLNKLLDTGIEAYMVMDGERGFEKKYSEYNKLKSNPKR